MREVIKEIAGSHKAVKRAIGSDSKSISNAPRRLGKRVTPEWVRQQGEPQNVVRRNFFESWILWKLAFQMAGRVREFRRLEVKAEALAQKLRRLLTDAPFPARSEREETLIEIRFKINELLAC